MRKKSFAVPSSVAQEAQRLKDSVPNGSESRSLIVQCRIEYICRMLTHSKLSSRQTLVSIHDIVKAKLGECHCRDKNGRKCAKCNARISHPRSWSATVCCALWKVNI